MASWWLMVILFSLSGGADVHPVPKYLEETSLIFNDPSCCAMPTKKAVMVSPAEAQYRMLSVVKLSKYCSNAIFPFFKIMNAFVFVLFN
jgi:hypothetical protein